MQLIPSIMTSYVDYNEEYRILICCQHKYAIPFKSIGKHFHNKHHGIPLSARQEILQYASSVMLYEPKDVVTSLEIIAPIHGLEIQRGYICSFDGCVVIQGTQESIKKLAQGHVWSEGYGSKWSELDVQKFFQGNRSWYWFLLMILMSRYFPVHSIDEPQPVTRIDQLIYSFIEQSEVQECEYQCGINEVKDTILLVTKT